MVSKSSGNQPASWKNDEGTRIKPAWNVADKRTSKRTLSSSDPTETQLGNTWHVYQHPRALSVATFDYPNWVIGAPREVKI